MKLKVQETLETQHAIVCSCFVCFLENFTTYNKKSFFRVIFATAIYPTKNMAGLIILCHLLPRREVSRNAASEAYEDYL